MHPRDREQPQRGEAVTGRSPSYIHLFQERGTPAALNYGDNKKLAGLLGCRLAVFPSRDRSGLGLRARRWYRDSKGWLAPAIAGDSHRKTGGGGLGAPPPLDTEHECRPELPASAHALSHESP